MKLMSGSTIDLRHSTVAILIAVLSSSGCIHITHTANVEPGWEGKLTLGARDETLDPPERFKDWEYDQTETGNVAVQADFGYGKRFSRARALYAGIMVPLVVHDGSVVGSMMASTLDLYFQFLGGPLDAGAGLLGGIAVKGVYFEIGRTIFSGSNYQLDMSAGLSGELYDVREYGYRGFSVVSWKREKMELGLWADYEWADDTIVRCDEECYSKDYLDSAWTFGLMMGWRFR